jgi:four helix bundle protein
MMPYERFAAWRACHRLTLEVYRATDSWPDRERYGLIAQARRAAFWAVANIAEGSAKRGPVEFRRFTDISIGSLTEVACALHVARDLGYLTEPEWIAVDRVRQHASILTWRLYRRLQAAANSNAPRLPPPPPSP